MKRKEIIRIKDEPGKKLIRWKNTGGSFHFGGRIIKPNQTFEADREDIPDAFMDTLIPLDNIPEVVDVSKQPAITKDNFNLHHRGGGWYDVVDKDGKAINEKAMKRDEAQELLENL